MVGFVSGVRLFTFLAEDANVWAMQLNMLEIQIIGIKLKVASVAKALIWTIAIKQMIAKFL